MEQRKNLTACGATWDAAAIENAQLLIYGDARYDDRRRMVTKDADDGGYQARPMEEDRSLRSTENTLGKDSHGKLFRESIRS